MAIPLTDFKTAAQGTFANLAKVFDGVYWRLGNTFDTTLDYFANVSSDEAAAFGQLALSRYKPPPGAWWDDYGWWGVAALRAFQQEHWFGGRIVQFKQIASDCWTAMDDNAPYVWDRRPKPGGTDYFASLEPRFVGGVWNSNWSQNTDNCQTDSCDPIKPCKGGLCGFQNTVTNGLYWTLAARLFTVFKQPPQLAAAAREHTFLKQWFDLTPSDDALLNSFGSGLAVVRERVSTYSSGGPVAGYQSDMAWAGDQGVILGGLVDMMLVLGKSSPQYPELLATAKAILAGSKTYLAQDGILQPWTPGMSPPGGDSDDYNTGVAAFYRYVLYAFQNNIDLTTYLMSPTSGYLEFVRDNAQHVVDNPSPTDDLTGLTNDLARLVAAVAMPL